MTIKPKHVLFAAMLLLNSNAALFAQKKGKASHGANADVRFINDIDSNPEAETTAVNNSIEKKSASRRNVAVYISNTESEIEKLTPLQLKFGLLLNTEVESIRNVKLFSLIDEWLGTAYRLGGTDKKGIDCSAFMQVLSMGVFSINLPRTAREQYNYAVSIETSELKEGDLVFFQSGGVISHVGFYLQNNKFVHASSSEGVMISDLNDSYWAKRFSGAGRIPQTMPTQTTLKP